MREQTRTRSSLRTRMDGRSYDDAPIGLAQISSDGHFLQVNPRLCALLGYTRSQLLGTTLWAVTVTEDLELMASTFRRLRAGEIDEIRLEQHLLRADGRPVPGCFTASVASGVGDRVFVCIFEADESGGQATSRPLDEVEEVRAVLDDCFDGVLATDDDGRIASFNSGAQKLFGYEAGEILGRDAKQIFAEGCREEFAGCLTDGASPGRGNAWAGARELWGRRKDGSIFPIEFRAARMLLGGKRRLVGILRDITEQKAQVEALESLNVHDLLTSLPNRTLLIDRLSQAILAESRQRRQPALLIMGVNGLGEVSDTHGQNIGDQLLQQMALRLERLLRCTDTVARVGGDQFGILPSPGLEGADGVTTAKKILKGLEYPFVIDDRILRVSAGIGIAVYPADGLDAPTLMRHAEETMQAARSIGCGYAECSSRG